MPDNLTIEFCNQLSEISPNDWNSLRDDDYPFSSYEFLSALEDSRCVSPETGWVPNHLIVKQGSGPKAEIVAALPLYVKYHSQGEYVFDHQWAKAYQEHSLAYYPKLLSAIPFTPCEGPRLLLKDSHKSVVPDLVLNKLKSTCETNNLSSCHCLFPEKDFVESSKKHNFLSRSDIQFHWFNHSYHSFDDFLGTLTSKKRKNIKRERKRIKEMNIEMQCIEGKDITRDQWEHFYQFYSATYWKRGREPYLNLDCFLRWHQTMPDNLLMVLAHNEKKEPVAAAVSFIGTNTLYGRYWGCLEEFHSLHFETCYYQGIEYCIQNKLSCFNSGAQGEHKISRGFEPVTTQSIHWIQNPAFYDAVSNFLSEEEKAVKQYKNNTEQYLPFKK